MQIEIAEPGRMTQTGSSMVRGIQNNNTPILDLFVRESVQNSLDAWLPEPDYVRVDFLTGFFDHMAFSNELEEITVALRRRYPDKRYKYLAVRDTNTYGLTGPLNQQDIQNNQYGNLIKLVYEINKPQDQEGAGGCWGLGKTVYFRVGMGLVLYYSRIRTDEGFASRLAVTMVEDENSPDAILSDLQGSVKRGIAWWGQRIGENKTQPLTDEADIHRILKFFDIKPYEGEETGTLVIIPYINEKELLSDNADDGSVQEEAGSETVPSEPGWKPQWMYSLEDFLKIAVQRWYAPRLDNPDYPYGKYLQASVNGKVISSHVMEAPFRIIQKLYQAASNLSNMEESTSEDGITVKNIAIRNVLKSTIAGKIAFLRADRNQLKMSWPDNCPAPYYYFGYSMDASDTNRPTICFTRKPGMIVSYETSGNWTDGIPGTDRDHFIIGLFVLNSVNVLKADEKYTLEEYIRSGEKADHISWNDNNIRSKQNPKIVAKIQNLVTRKIRDEYAEKPANEGEVRNSGYSKLFGDVLLPPQNFGSRSGSGSGSGGTGGSVTHKKGVSLTVDQEGIEYAFNTLTLHMTLTADGSTMNTGITLGVDAESGTLSAKDWEIAMGLQMPFSITSAELVFRDAISGNKITQLTVAHDSPEVSNNDFNVSLLPADRVSHHTIRLGRKTAGAAIAVEMSVTIRLTNRELKPVISIIEVKE